MKQCTSPRGDGNARPGQQYRLFTVVGNTPTEPLAPISEDEGGSEHKIGGILVKGSGKMTLGVFEGIGSGIWKKEREYMLYVRYEIRPLPVQNGEPGPMFMSAAMMTREAKIRETLICLINRAITRSTRIWLWGQVMVKHEGKFYRSQRDIVAIDRTFTDKTGHDPEWLPDDNLAWKEYMEATHSMGRATGYQFKKWIHRENIWPTLPNHREVWQAAQVESKVWNSSDDFGRQFHAHIDMRAAYLGCEDSVLGASSDGMDLVREYVFPANVYLSTNVEGMPIAMSFSRLELYS